MREGHPHQLVWCLGMYASGSTWLYNAARAAAAALYPGHIVAGQYADELKALKSLPPALNVVKTHDLPASAAKFMSLRAERILVSLRDPRDAVTSLMQHMGENFRSALQRVEASAQFAARHAGDARTRLFIYENGFTDTEAAFDTIAAALGGRLTPDQRRMLFDASRRDKIEEKISRLEELPTAWRNPATGDLLDRDTRWHRHHAGRSGETGRWRQVLTAQEAAMIERRLSVFMRRFDYPGEYL